MNQRIQDLLNGVIADNFKAVANFLEDDESLLARARDAEGNTPLHLVRSPKMVRLLGLYGADPKAVNNRDQQPDEMAKDPCVTKEIRGLWPESQGRG